MDTRLENLYESMLKGSTTSTIKAGDGFEGEDKANIKAVKSPDPLDAEGIKTKKPAVGPSQDKSQGKPEKLTKKCESVETKSIPMTFDQLFSQTINEEDESIVPASDIESDEFSEDTGDFGKEENDVDEEIDLASELRLLADRLTEIADKLAIDNTDDVTGEGEIDDVEPAEEDLTSDDERAGGPMLGKESFRRKGKLVKEAIKSEPTPKPLKKSGLGPKMSMNPKNKIGRSGAGKASMPTGTKDRTGVPSNAPKTQFGPKMSQHPSGSGPAVKGSNASLVA